MTKEDKQNVIDVFKRDAEWTAKDVNDFWNDKAVTFEDWKTRWQHANTSVVAQINLLERIGIIGWKEMDDLQAFFAGNVRGIRRDGVFWVFDTDAVNSRFGTVLEK